MKVEKQIEAFCFAVNFLIQALYMASNALRPFDLCESSRAKVLRFPISQRIAVLIYLGKKALHIVLNQIRQAVDCMYACRIITIFDARNPRKNRSCYLQWTDGLLVIVTSSTVLLQCCSDIPHQVDDGDEIPNGEPKTCRHLNLVTCGKRVNVVNKADSQASQKC